MAKQVGKRQPKKKKRKVSTTLQTKMKVVKKKMDNTLDSLRQVPTIVPNNSAVFKIKIKRK